MRPLLTLLILLIVAAPASAVEPWDNWLSLVWDPYSTAYDHDCQYQEVDQTITVTLWLVRPVNPDFGTDGERAVTSVGGFQCAVTASEGLNLLGWTPAAPATVFTNGAGMRMTYDAPLPVVDGRVALATCQVYVGGITSFPLPESPLARCTNHANAFTYVGPALFGTVSYVDADDPTEPEVAPHYNEGDHDLQFEIHQAPVPAAAPAWGTVKALYR